MNKTVKKCISFVLVLSIVLTYIPLDILLANYQSLVTSMSISNLTPRGATTSTIKVDWAKPAQSTREDTSAIDGAVLHDPTGYNVFYRNGTKKEAYSSANVKNVPATGAATESTEISAALANNSIYSFMVDPYHIHQPKDTTKSPYTAPKETGTLTEALNLTDIKVTSESVNGGFKLTWGNPTYMGANVFSGYRLYYVPQSSSTTNFIPFTSSYVDMNLNDKNAIFNKDGTITYTFETSAISIGQIYSLKIEPLYEGTPIRLDTTPRRVTINGKEYQLAYGDKTTHEYRFNGAYVKPSLYIKQEGTENVRLYWNPISTTSGSTVKTVSIYSYANDDPNQQVLIGTLADQSATTINNWLLKTPTELTSYKIVIQFSDGVTMESNKVYYDPAFNDFDPYKPIIHQSATNITKPIPEITINWQAFLRKPYNKKEQENVLSKYDNQYNDKDLSYRIWVTDDLNNLTNNYFQPNFIIDDSARNFNSGDITIPGTQNHTLAYNTTFNKYYSFDDEVAELKNLEGNKIYYIKIVATRDNTLQKSEPEYYSVFLPPTSDIEVNPLTMDTPPLRVAKDENGAYIVTDTTMDITWDTQWFEVYDENTDTWNAVVAKRPDGTIIFGKDALKEDAENILTLYTPFDPTQTLDSAKIKINNFLGVEDIPVRKMDITNSKFEIFTVEYNYLEEQGGYEAYYSTIEDSTLWHTITPKANGTSLVYQVNTEEAPTVGELLPNTSYVVYMRNYTINSKGEKIYAYNPSYVVSNTIDTPADIDVTPTAQVITAVSSTDTTVTYKWLYSDAFTYNFKYSSKTADYSEGGITVTNDEILKNCEFKTENDQTYIYYTVKNLFPNTTYYAWINAKGATKVSPWSSPASMTTKDLHTPDVPRGLGPMGSDNVKIINENQGKKYKAIDEHSIIIEWTRIFEDTKVPTTGITADNTGYGEEILLDALITNTYGVKYNELKANTRYYFRVKSRITATKNADNSSNLAYSYFISMADNEDFLDALEFEVPYIGAVDDDSVTTIVKESAWSPTISLITGTSSDEYDGDFNPDLYPLPETDFELIYNEVTGELTYVFRGPGVDSTGKPNNGADQRFISKVINQHIYDFSVDLTRYQGIDVPKRKVVIPYSIITALENQKVTLTIKTGNMYTKVDLGLFRDCAIANNVSTYNKNVSGEIYIYEDNTLGGLLGYGQSYVSKPQKVSLRLKTPERAIVIDTLQKPLNIGLAIDNRFITQDSNVNPYKQIGGNTGSWTPVNSKYNVQINKFEFDTKNTGTFSVISKPIPTNTQAGTSAGNNAEGSMYSVNSVINITDMPYFTPSNLITANQFNNIVWAVVNDSPTVSMNKTLDQTSYTELGRGKLLVSGTYVTREKGMASLARLYELKTKNAIVPASALANQGYSDYAKVDSQYQAGVNKAIEIGMLDGSSIRPKDNMTYGEFMYMLEAVALDQ